MSYGHTAPAGVPQHIWDDAIDLWLNLSTADSDDIKTIADRLMASRAQAEADLERSVMACATLADLRSVQITIQRIHEAEALR